MSENRYMPRITQGKFNKISKFEGEWCFHLASGEHDLEKNNLIEITITKDIREFKALHYVGNQFGSTDYRKFTVQEELMLSEGEMDALKIDPHNINEMTGYWSKLHPYELSISKCNEILVELGFKWNSIYFKALYRIQEDRLFKSGKSPQICDERYLHAVLNMSFKEIDKMDLFDIDKMNSLLRNIHCSYVNFDSRVVQLSDNYIIQYEEYGTSYFHFLCLLICVTPINKIDDLLNYHHQKNNDGAKFCRQLEDFFLELSDSYKDYKIISKVNKWIELQMNPPTPVIKAETKTYKLKTELGKYGFFDLEKVKILSTENREKLIELISHNAVPYGVAMLDYLGCIAHLEKEHFPIKSKLYKKVSNWFNSDIDGRTVKGNLSTLSAKTDENKLRFTAHTHKERVKSDYQALK